ncbi:MAG: MOSC domain-containing protein [Gemmatimonas sp.]
MAIRISALYRYPIKSTAGIPVDHLALDELGAVDDRRWMLVDDHNRFMTQREIGSLALVRSSVTGDGLRLEAVGHSPLDVRTPASEVHEQQSLIWDDMVAVQDAGDAAAQWCSAVTGVKCRLVHLAASAERPLHPKYAGAVDPANRHVSLSDGAPLLIVSEASLVLLNEHMAARGLAPVGFDRFRPNVVLTGATAHEEDTWRAIEIAGITIGVGTPCPRCVMTTVDQSVGVRASALNGEPGGEPLRTLATYRRQGNGVMFGMNATNETAGVLRVGDEVRVVEMK